MSAPHGYPGPKVVRVVCNVCGEPWGQHQADRDGSVSLHECVRLLKRRIPEHPGG